MAKTLLIGSSNTYRFIGLLKESERALVKMEPCTKMCVFRVKMDNLQVTDKRVLITVIENFICDKHLEMAESGGSCEDSIKMAIEDFGDEVKKTALRLPKSRFVLVQPIRRPAVEWYTENLQMIVDLFQKKIVGLGLMNISLIKDDDLPTQIFDELGTHLIESMGMQFLQAILYGAQRVFDAPVVDVDGDGGTMEVDEQAPEGSGSSIEDMKTNEERLNEVIAKLEKRQENDNLLFARIREELDFIANTKKEDRIVISGMSTSVPKPANQVEARQWINDIVKAALGTIVEEAGEMVQFVSANRSFGMAVPVCEVKIKDREGALRIRKEFGKQRKDGKVTGGIFVSNSVTLGTRVRLEVLRAIAKKCSGPEEDMFVHGFVSRPVLQIRPKNGGAQRALTYVDAIVRYGCKVNQADLGLAYERAGTSFVGQMAQNFVVLSDKGVRRGGGQSRGGGSSGQPRMTGGNKRALDEGNEMDVAAKRQMGGRRGASGGTRGGRWSERGRGKSQAPGTPGAPGSSGSS